MSFLFVDRVIALDRNERILAAKQVSLAEDYFAWHFPGQPIMPASLMIEAAAQAATILLEVSCEFESKAFVAFVSDAKFRSFVKPGREIEIRLEVTNRADGATLLRGEISQGSERCATIRLGMGLLSFGEVIPADQQASYRGTFRHWLAEARLSGFERSPSEML